jgi:hypothetical protein
MPMKTAAHPLSSTSNLFLGATIFLLLLTAQLTIGQPEAQQSCLHKPAGLVAWWPGDGDAADFAGTNAGTPNNGVTYTTGEVGQAFQFNGVLISYYHNFTGSNVTIPDAPALDVQPTGFTVECWMEGVKNQNVSDPYAPDFDLIDKSHGWTDYTGWTFEGDDRDGTIFFGIGDGSSFPGVNSTVDVLDGNWHHLCGTWDGSNVQLYVDGVSQGSVPLTNPANNNRPLNFAYSWGGTGGPTRFFRGLLDEVSIYNRALSATEIQQIYAAGTAGKCKATTIVLTSLTYSTDTQAGSATVYVTRHANTNVTNTIQYATANGTAIAGQDYTRTSGTLIFNPGDVTKTISIPIINHPQTSSTNFQVSLKSPTGAALGSPRAATVTIHPAGRILTSIYGGYGLYEYNADTSNPLNLTPDPLNFVGFSNEYCSINCHYNDDYPSASQNGLIAFESNRDGTGYRIFVMNSDGTGIRQVTTNAGALDGDFSPAISADGTRIAFLSRRNGEPGGTFNIYLVNAAGTPVVTQVTSDVTAGTGYDAVVWDPADNSKLAYRSHGATQPNMGVGYLTLDGNGHIISDTFVGAKGSTGVSFALDWSPNGRYLDVIWGAEAQGAPPKVMTLFDLQLNTTTDISSDPNMGEALGDIRFSPDSQRIAIVESGTLNFIDLTGASLTTETNPVSSQPIWWQDGASIPDPVRLELAPAEVAVYNGGVSVDVVPTVYDAQGNVILHVADNWTNTSYNSELTDIAYESGSPHANISVQPGWTSYDIEWLLASNGGLTARVDQLVNPPAITALSAVSRKTHGRAGTFDLNLPLSGTGGIECRSGGVSGDHTMVVSFALPVTFTSASLVSGTGTVADAFVTGSNVEIDLTNITNAQTLSLQLTGVTDTFSAGNVTIPMSVLLGDTVGDGRVTNADVNQTRSQVGQPVTVTNFREDVTVDGQITNSDAQTVRSKVGTHLP